MAFESPTRIEPCLFGDAVPSRLVRLAAEIQAESVKLGQKLHPQSLAELAEFVRLMNCYYSNLIEGHNTRPRDIELALQGAELADGPQRNLALIAKAHVIVQREIDEAQRLGKMSVPTSVAFLSEVHKRFYEEMPESLRVMEGTDIPVVPGQFRRDGDREVAVGQHLPPSSPAVAGFMAYFEKRFAVIEKEPGINIIAAASAHHRFNYIHPFLDGNGRVGRLMSHAMFQRYGVGSGGLWSISRGLARGLKDRGEYKQMMAVADAPRDNDLDGHGNLSLRTLTDFCEWFLEVSLDQIKFSQAMFDFTRLESRYRALAKDAIGDKRAGELISAILRYGAMERGAAGVVLGVSPRTARSTVSELVETGFLKSETPKSALRIAFPVDYRERLFPNLFTDGDFGAGG